MHIDYRAEVDGLRAVAILPVVLFHLGVVQFSGGFVGVDVFFVISGFLITSIIYNGIKENNFSYKIFYIRRAKRILPVLLTVVTVTYIVGLTFFWPVEMNLLAKSTVATLLFVSNIFFWFQIDYFGPESHIQPLLHTWSISVEEQYYIIFPLLMLLLARLGRGLIQKTVVALLVIGFILSTWAFYAYPSAAFYLFPFRFWELMVGSALAVLPVPKAGRVIGNVAFLIGLAMIGLAVATFTEASSVPGPAALLPCIGTALIIWSGPDARNAAGRLLANPLTVGIGKISYSMYLWHWPMIVYLPIVGASHDALSTSQLAWYFAALIAISAASYYFIENPFRRYPIFTTRGRSTLVGGAVACVATIFIAGVVTEGFPQRLSSAEAKIYETVNYYQNSPSQPKCFMRSQSDASRFPVEKCMGRVEGSKSVLVWGDSVAAYQSTGIVALGSEAGFNMMVATMGGCRPMAGATFSKACDGFTKIVHQAVMNARPDIIVLSARWSQPDSDPGKTGLRVPERALALARSLRDEGFEVVVLGPPVQFTEKLPLAMLESDIKQIERYDTTSIFFSAAATIDDYMAELFAGETGIRYISVIRNLCNGPHCVALADGIPLTWDEHHLTEQGSLFLARRIIGDILRGR